MVETVKVEMDVRDLARQYERVCEIGGRAEESWILKRGKKHNERRREGEKWDIK